MSLNQKIRSEVESKTNIFYVVSEGYAADHMFSWFCKSLNKHPDVFALLAHEGSRPKYLKERTRGERPNIENFSEFLHDMGMTYEALGDCYSYRTHHLIELNKFEKFKNIPKLYLIRNPVVWLYFYQQWRSSNMRMGSGKTNPLDWEWNVANHKYFEELNLKKYGKEDVDVWSFYQGLHLLDMTSETYISQFYRTERIEDIYGDKTKYSEIFSFLTNIALDKKSKYLENVFHKKEILYKGENILPEREENFSNFWESWQIEAFFKIIRPESIEIFEKFYSTLPKNTKNFFFKKQDCQNIFISSQLKSGTHLLRKIMQMITNQDYYEPFLNKEEPPNNKLLHNYHDLNLIRFPENKFYSWHNIINSDTKSLLLSSRTTNIFLVRNIYEILFSLFNHFKNDVDQSIKRSIGKSAENQLFKNGYESAFFSLINGYTSSSFSFPGIRVIVEQIKSYCDFLKEKSSFFITYDHLVNNKESTIINLCKYLNLEITYESLQKILIDTSKENMGLNNPHVTKNRNKKIEEIKKSFHDGHIGALQFQVFSVFQDDHASRTFCDQLQLFDYKDS